MALVVLPLPHAAGMEIDSVTEVEDASLRVRTTKALRLRNVPQLLPVLALRKESLLKEKGDHSKVVAAAAADVVEEGAALPRERLMSHFKEKHSRKDSSPANFLAAVVGWEGPGVADVGGDVGGAVALLRTAAQHSRKAGEEASLAPHSNDIAGR